VLCQIPRKVIHRLQRKWGGEEFIGRMLTSGGRCGDYRGCRIASADRHQWHTSGVPPPAPSKGNRQKSREVHAAVPDRRSGSRCRPILAREKSTDRRASNKGCLPMTLDTYMTLFAGPVDSFIEPSAATSPKPALRSWSVWNAALRPGWTWCRTSASVSEMKRAWPVPHKPTATGEGQRRQPPKRRENRRYGQFTKQGEIMTSDSRMDGSLVLRFCSQNKKESGVFLRATTSGLVVEMLPLDSPRDAAAHSGWL